MRASRGAGSWLLLLLCGDGCSDIPYGIKPGSASLIAHAVVDQPSWTAILPSTARAVSYVRRHVDRRFDIRVGTVDIRSQIWPDG